MVVCFDKFLIFFLKQLINQLPNRTKTLMCTHLYFWLSVSMQSCMLFKGERKSCSQAVRVLASKAQRVAHVLNPLITSVLLMFMTGSGYIVIPILDLFSTTGSGITHVSLSELDLFRKCSQSLSLFRDISNFRYNFQQLYHAVQGLNINTFINYAIYLPESFLWLVFFIVILKRAKSCHLWGQQDENRCS